jgi:hypothetical protein
MDDRPPKRGRKKLERKREREREREGGKVREASVKRFPVIIKAKWNRHGRATVLSSNLFIVHISICDSKLTTIAHTKRNNFFSSSFPPLPFRHFHFLATYQLGGMPNLVERYYYSVI